MTASSQAQQAPQGARTLIIGTGLTVRQLCGQLAFLSRTPQVVGVLLPPGVDRSPADLSVAPPRLGDFDDLNDVLQREEVEQAMICLPVTMHEQIRTLAETLDAAGASWRFLPALSDQLTGRATFTARGVTISACADELGALDAGALLDRRPRPLDQSAIERTVAGKVVLITGAGGSIGSELARQAAGYRPARLILVERSENALFEIDRELARRFPNLPRAAVLHDVTDASRTRSVVARHGPQIIFHAAAHKHVPMMEDHPSQAVENNFYGTRSIADAALAQGAERFVMISTDKAVNPTSVMGASKRLAELYIQYLNQQGRTRFCMVRFGNVLGSACSVLPIWTRQLAQGGPITITHPAMTRYFMTIPEAAGLVMQSAALSGRSQGAKAGGGEVFVLDMGTPIRILDLAHRFLRCRGLEPDVDIRVIFTGVRPGEKLYEELSYAGEELIPTPHESIRLWRTLPPDAARIRQMTETFDRLRRPSSASGHAWDSAPPDAVVHALRAAVPEMVRAAAG